MAFANNVRRLNSRRRAASVTRRRVTMTTLHLPAEEPEVRSAGTPPPSDGPVHRLERPTDVADLIRDVNESNEAVEDQCLRARQGTDVARRSAKIAKLSAATAEAAKVAHRTIQAERPRSRASLPRQVVFALVTVVLDGLACYFAAQALDGSQDATLV